MEIPLIQPLISFGDHFDNVSNKRILFSGKFGSGKTYFLKDFFALRSDTVNTFWLSPVKYSVSQNEDIFEYIKFDLALKLLVMLELAKPLEVEFGENLYLYEFLSDQPLVAIDTLMLLMGGIANGDSIEAKTIEIAGAVKGVSEKLIDLYKKYSAFKVKIKESNRSESILFENYLKGSTLRKGSIFENDLITQTIRAALEICKLKNEKDNVLIIDDFDRLDPEHVFRILNILSVHNEIYDDENKFGFDKVIIVCDYDNIQNTYQHKYGSKINFLGYISKFFSSEVYHFNNRAAIRHFCEYELSEVIDNQNVQDVLGLLLSYFVETGLINIRDIIKIKIQNIYVPIEYGPYNLWNNHPTGVPRSLSFMPMSNNSGRFITEGIDTFFISSADYPFIRAIRVLCVIFGGYSELKTKIKNIDHKNEGYSKEYIPKIIKSIMALLHHVNCNTSAELGRLCFSYRRDEYNEQWLLRRPSTIIFGVDLLIPTGWEFNNKYPGDVSYYKNVNSNMELIDYTNPDLKFTDYGSYKALTENLLKILNFLQQSGTLERMSVTSQHD